jgi:S-DNA-T family DNA segregation ATPase FtsK/SpoIIIE
MRTTTFSFIDHVPASVREFPKRRAAEIAGLVALAGVASLTVALATWSVSDPSLNHATNERVHNLLGAPGAIAADLVMQFIGLASVALLAPPAFWGWSLVANRRLERPRSKVGLYFIGVIATAGLASLLPAPGSWPLPTGLGGVVGDAVLALPCRNRYSRARRRIRRWRLAELSRGGPRRCGRKGPRPGDRALR